jgi:hypothetical protein
MGLKLVLSILIVSATSISCSRSAFESSKTANISTFSNTPTCEEITETNAYLQWCNQNTLSTSEVREVCYGLAYISGQYRKILKLESYGQAPKCYVQLKASKNIFIPECDSAYAQTYDSLKGEETLNVFECQQNAIGIFYIHAVKNTQKLFTVFSK